MHGQSQELGDLRCELLHEIQIEAASLNLSPQIHQALIEVLNSMLSKYGCNF